MTDEIREVFVGMGSTLITSVKRRDNWVFAGGAGRDNKSFFEKVSEPAPFVSEKTSILKNT